MDQDARGSLAHAVAHGAASQQRLQHAIAQARSSASLFKWVIDVGRRTDILHRFRLQWRSEAWSCGSLRTTIERSLDVNHRKGSRPQQHLAHRQSLCCVECGSAGDRPLLLPLTESLGHTDQLGLRREHTVLQPRLGRLQACSGIPRQRLRLCCAMLPSIPHRLRHQHGQHGHPSIRPFENLQVSEKRLPCLLLEAALPQWSPEG